VNRGIRRVGGGVLVLFVVVALQLTYLQIFRANDLKADPNNVRAFLRDISRPRGPIVTADGEIVAESIPSDDEIERQRRYPLGPLFAHVAGFQSIVFGTTGVERTYNDELVGRNFDLRLGLGRFVRGEDRVGTVVLTLTAQAQAAARDALGGRRGSVVALDVRSGAVLAMYAEPTYDPNPLAGHDAEAVQAVQRALTNDPNNPQLARAWRERYAPGSTFKVVTAALSLEAGIAPPERVFPTISELPLPQTDDTLENFGGSSCGGNLEESFIRSCNTTFGQLGLDLNERLASGVEQFGLNVDPPPADVNPPVVRSVGPERGTFRENQPTFAQAAIGQNQVAVTPLEMAMIAASVGNGGRMMVPHVVSEIRNVENERIADVDPRLYREAMRPETAAELTRYMVGVVNQGTGSAAQIPGIQVAGKTGTAQVEGRDPHAWFIAFAPADNPVYAVAVLVENGGDLGSEATGGRVAAPIAAHMLQVLLAP
jgi:peptidoglycan glycosyltransferase